MAQPPAKIAALLSAAEAGRTCAAAALGQRDLLGCAARYPELFPAKPFDAAFFSTITLANTFCAPWHSAEELRIANRITLWIFGLDRLIDYVARTPDEVADLVTRCLAVSLGGQAEPGDPVAAFLVEVRDELSVAPAYERMADIWRDELRRMLESMAREWGVKAARLADPRAALPSLDAYLDDAEFGFSLVYVAHWIRTADPATPADIDRLRAAGWAVQRVIRLLNDLGTYHRDLGTGDLNALGLADRPAVEQRLAVEIARSEELLAVLTPVHPGLALFLDRHIRFNSGFYRVTDYQGEL
jgi:Terpene synthase family 2, C-terminal metal binding